MKLLLTVQVQSGGELWERCWRSIKENIGFFDKVFISINHSAAQDEDAARVENFSSPRIFLRRQPQHLDEISHLADLDKWVFQTESSGHIFRLKDDALLLQDGLAELSTCQLASSDAFAGSFRFVHPEEKIRTMTVREFKKSDGTPLSADLWNFLQYQQPFLLTLSGTVLPFSAAKESFFLRTLLKNTKRLPEMHLCTPGVTRIFQTWHPVVEALYPEEPVDSSQYRQDLQHDEILCQSLIFALSKDPWTRLFISRLLLYSVQKNHFKGLCCFFKAQFSLLRSGRKLSAILPLYLYIGKIFRTKVINVLKKGSAA